MQDSFFPSTLMTNHIRLLRLNTDFSTPNIGSLEVTAHDDAPPYYALSHCWGTQAQDVPVQADSQPFYVSSDLAAGLHRLRELAAEVSFLSISIKYIWVDKICINQRNIPELSSQVKIMGKIYTKAVRTLVWLGPELVSSLAAWRLLDRIYGVFRDQNLSAKVVEDIPKRLCYSEPAHNTSGLPSMDDEQWANLRELLQVKWFTRIWIIQEVVLSSEDPIILHGKHVYPWSRLGWVAAWLRRNGYVRLSQIPPEIYNIDAVCLLRRSQKKWLIEALLSFTQVKFHATNQRDKVYGLLGLAAECQDEGTFPEVLRPDYTIDVALLYSNIGRFLIKIGRSFAITTRCHGSNGSLSRTRRQHKLPGLPSWSPDWSDFRVFNDRLRTSFAWIDYSDPSKPATLGYPAHYAASAGLEIKLYETADDPLALRVAGLRLDEVVRVIPFSMEIEKDSRFSPQFAVWFSQIAEVAMVDIMNGNVVSWAASLIKTTTAEQHRLAGRNCDQSSRDGLAYLYEHLLHDAAQLALLQSKSGSREALDLLRVLSERGEPREYEVLATNFCFSRSFFITVNGRMGIGPSDSQIGDTVSVIQGGCVPYIIRHHDKGKWIFVGESYVHGLMNGEAILALRHGKMQEEIFELR
ncbi:HET domain-containing protein [Hypoxylon rubiginosum]|uniref:HET domain-containing protein n=1 Tax=Hypoxylon rubiginosum TaxID=110542 RepID=A0ACB9YQP2_9PEZI|nr:HET domain-containing protein [Hypoxylon rubiginosum]